MSLLYWWLPNLLPEEPKEMTPEYDEDEDIDYALDEEDRINEILDDMSISNYDDVEKQLNRKEKTPSKAKKSLKNKVVEKAKETRDKLKGYKSQVSTAYNEGKIQIHTTNNIQQQSRTFDWVESNYQYDLHMVQYQCRL